MEKNCELGWMMSVPRGSIDINNFEVHCDFERFPKHRSILQVCDVRIVLKPEGGRKDEIGC